MRDHYDAIVIGLGGMGSAALYHLVKRGLRVLGIEQFEIGHDRGSSHGETRIIRRAYFEHPDYVPLVDLSYAGWATLEREAGLRLFERTGLLLAGPANGEVIGGTRRAAAEHALEIEELSHADCRRRFPAIRIGEDVILFEADAGFLHVEDCVQAYVDQAQRLGADTAANSMVREWSSDGQRCAVQISTAGGRAENRTIEAEQLIICGGAWSACLLVDLRLPLEVRRKVVLWYQVEGNAFRRDRGFPVFGVEWNGQFFYGFPSLDGRTMKIANHTGGETVADPSGVDRALRPGDNAEMEKFIARHFARTTVGQEPSAPHARPEGVGDILRHSICMYTMTPDQHFIVDRHPQHSNVCFAAGFSGHGFKFAPIIGSALADLATGTTPSAGMDFLRFRRFASTSA
jgi:sarcosine oxidase